MADDKGPFDWNTWMWWVSLTALGGTTAYVLMSIVITVLGASIFGATGDDQTASMALQVALAPLFALAGAAMGAGQWLMLRSMILRAGWWVLATAGGWMAGYLLSLILFPPDSDTPSLFLLLVPWLLFGLATGLCQWLVLRPYFHRSANWIPVATVTTVIGASGWLIGGMMGGAISWLAAGALSGWVLMRVLPRKQLWPERRVNNEG